jgi:hypothetical protein
MAHRSFLVSIAESPASDANLAYSVGRGLAIDGEPLAHRCFSLGRNLAYLSPPKRASPDSPWLAHSVPTPYGVNLGHRGLRFCTATERHRPDFHWFGNVLFNSRAQRPATPSPKRSGVGYRRLEGRGSLTKRTKPKATNKANLTVRIQPSACTPCWARS